MLTTGGDSGTGLPGLSLVSSSGHTNRELAVSARRSVSGGTAWELDLDFFIRYDGSDFDSNGTIAIQVPAAIHTGSTPLPTGTVTVAAVDETTPGQVMGVSVTAGTEQLTVTWTAVSGATGYKVQWKSGSEMYDTDSRQAESTGTSHTITGLTGGTQYTLRVSATKTKADDGMFSTEATGTPRLGQVMGVMVTPGPGQLGITWTAVSGATNYQVQWKSGSEGYNNTRQAAASSNSYTIPNLTAGTEYTLRVRATGTPTGLAQVTGVRVTAGTRQLQVTWNSAIGATGYKVQWKSGSESYNTTDRQATTANTNHTITNLDSVAYTLRVLATRAGLTDGPASSEIVGVPLGSTDYDQNDNNLIDVTTLAQLDAIRYDLDGNGSPTGNISAYNLAFLGRATDMGCPTTCTGYELMNDLDFDTNGDGDVDVNDGEIAWGRGTDAGNGWLPIGDNSNRFTATFQGNGHTITNLFINRLTTSNTGLFSVSTGRLSQLGLVNVEVTGVDRVGGLVGHNRGTVSTSYVSGQVTGTRNVGGLVGLNEFSSTITASYASGRVTGNDAVGGLVGLSFISTITASYATGQVTRSSSVGGVGGLVGASAGGTPTNSYYDRETSGQSDTGKGEPKTTVELQTPTDYTEIYADWNIDVDGETGNDNPWAFGADYQYPVLRYRRTQAQINAQFFLQIQEGDLRMLADVNQDLRIDAQDALIMYRTYLPVPGPTEDQRTQATAWQRQGRAVGGDLNGDSDINEQDALIMFYVYQFRVLLQNHAALRQLLFNGLRGSGSQQMPPTDTTYREFLRRALRLR